MTETVRLAEEFERHRGYLRSIAYRVLGSLSDADDAVQDAWIRLGNTEHERIDNLRAWLTTVVSRASLDILRARSRRSEVQADDAPEPIDPANRHEQDVLLEDAMGPALGLVLDTLQPAERLAFVLGDLFGVPYPEIAVIVDRSPDATRQMASRARRRIRTAAAGSDPVDPDLHRDVVLAFLRASRDGDFDGLLKVLDPDIVVRADTRSVEMGMAAEVRGATAVLNTFLGRAVGAQPAFIDGLLQAAWAPGGRLRAVIAFSIIGGVIRSIDLLADPDGLASLDVTLVPKSTI